MSHHLTPCEFVDLIDGQLDASRSPHLETCGFCRKQVEDVQESLRLSSELQMPEPSPLFWDHFSNHVRGGVAARDAAEGVETVRAGPVLRNVLAIATLLIVAAAGWYLRPGSGGEPSGAGAGRITDDAALAADQSASDAWETARAAAERVDWDAAEAAGLSARPDSIDRAILDLDDREREQLIFLLEEELERAGT